MACSDDLLAELDMLRAMYADDGALDIDEAAECDVRVCVSITHEGSGARVKLGFDVPRTYPADGKAVTVSLVSSSRTDDRQALQLAADLSERARGHARACELCVIQLLEDAKERLASMGGSSSCLICLDAIGDSAQVVRTRCDHTFHMLCMYTWLCVRVRAHADSAAAENKRKVAAGALAAAQSAVTAAHEAHQQCLRRLAQHEESIRALQTTIDMYEVQRNAEAAAAAAKAATAPTAKRKTGKGAKGCSVAAAAASDPRKDVTAATIGDSEPITRELAEAATARIPVLQRQTTALKKEGESALTRIRKAEDALVEAQATYLGDMRPDLASLAGHAHLECPSCRKHIGDEATGAFVACIGAMMPASKAEPSTETKPLFDSDGAIAALRARFGDERATPASTAATCGDAGLLAYLARVRKMHCDLYAKQAARGALIVPADGL